MKLLLIALLAVLALALAGCGGDDGDDEAEPPAATSEPVETDGAEASGESVFTSNCGSCHTLAAAGTSGTTGPNLDELAPDAARVETQVRNGGGGMPAFEGQLSDAEITAVAEYVASNAGG